MVRVERNRGASTPEPLRVRGRGSPHPSLEGRRLSGSRRRAGLRQPGDRRAVAAEQLCYRAAGSASTTKPVDGRAIARDRGGSVPYAAERLPRDMVGRRGLRIRSRVSPSRGDPARGQEQLDLASAPRSTFLCDRGPLARRLLPDPDERARVCNPLDRSAVRCCSTRASTSSSSTCCVGIRGGRRQVSRGRPRAAHEPAAPGLLRRAEDYIRANLAGEISLASLARLSCMSVDHFLRLFRAACGLTPYQYVLEQRLRKASVCSKRATRRRGDRGAVRVRESLAFLGEVPRPLRRQSVPLPPGRVATAGNSLPPL